MNSKLILYGVPFSDDENKLIENINEYLTNEDRLGIDILEETAPAKVAEINDFQFIKHKLNLEIKIVGTQLLAPAFNANYCSITNNDWDESGEEPSLRQYGGTYYYFITDITQMAENTLKLTLKMDVLNTFENSILHKDNWLPETFVEREHRDRFFDDDDYLFEDWHTSYDGHETLSLPLAHIKVDNIPEDIDLPLYKTNDHKLKGVFNNAPFYLVYKASTMYSDGSKPVEQIERDNAIRCFLVAGSGTSIPMLNYYGNAVDLVVSQIGGSDFANLSTGEWVFLDDEDNPDMLVYSRYKNANNEYKNQGFFAREIKRAGYHLVFGIKKQTSTTYRCFVKLFTTTNATTETAQGADETGFGILVNQDDGIANIPYSYYVNGPDARVRRDVGRVGNSSQGSRQVFNVRKGWKDTTIAINNDDNLPSALQTWANWKTYKTGLTAITLTENSEIVNMKTIDEVDRTDSRIVKIIELPYAPNEPHANGSGDNLYYDFGSNWSSSADLGDDIDMANCFQLTGTSMEKNFYRDFGSSTYNYDDDDNCFYVECLRNLYDYIGENFIHARVSALETKLQHSDFYKPVIYYDNFSVEFKCEKRYNTFHQEWSDGSWLANALKEPFDINYAVANNIVNGLVFSITDDINMLEYTFLPITHYEAEDYYPLTMVCIRNNEVNIYNSAYLQYIRGGFNYDVKAKNLSIMMAEHQNATSLGNAFLGAITPNPVGAVSSIIGGIFNYERQKELIRMQAKQYQNSMDKSLKEASLRAPSVSGSDNLDLLKHYGGNCLHKAVFKLNDVWTDKIARLFHYYGYATNMNKVPNLTGRLFFNYVKCTPVFQNPIYVLAWRKEPPRPLRAQYGTNAELQNEVVKKFGSGVSIIHQYHVVDGENSYYSWNVSQDKENWEAFLEPLNDKSNFIVE